MKKVWIVEHRMYIDKFRGIENVVVFVASSLKKAENFIRKNYKDFKEKTIWWWVIYPESLDKDSMKELGEDYKIKVYSPKGKELENQPVPKGKL